MTEPLPDMVPRTVAGQRVAPMPLADGTIPRTRRQAFGASMRFSNDFVVDRWRMLNDTDETINEAEFNELVEGKPVSFFQGITRRQAERRLAEYDFQQWDQQFTQAPFSQFAGMAIPFFYEPGTIASMPAGARNIANITRAGSLTFRQFMQQSTVGASKIAGVSVPLEAAAQIRQTGVVEPMTLAATGLVPFALTPAFGALGRGVRLGLGRIKDGPMTKNVIDATHGRVDPETASRIADNTASSVPPRPRVLSSDPMPPTERLNVWFQGYPGGRAQWLRDISAGKDLARSYARDLGLDPDAPSVRDLVVLMQDRSAQTFDTPPSYNGKVLHMLNRLRAGKATPDDISSLTDAGLVLPRARLVGGELVPTGENALSVTGRLLDDALRNSKTPENRAFINSVIKRGSAAVDEVAARRGIDLDPDTNPQASPNRVASAEVVSDEDLLKALDAAWLKTARRGEGMPTDTPPARDPAPGPQKARIIDADQTEIDAGIRRMGGDPEQLNNIRDRILAQMDTCARPG